MIDFNFRLFKKISNGVLFRIVGIALYLVILAVTIFSVTDTSTVGKDLLYFAYSIVKDFIIVLILIRKIVPYVFEKKKMMVLAILLTAFILLDAILSLGAIKHLGLSERHTMYFSIEISIIFVLIGSFLKISEQVTLFQIGKIQQLEEEKRNLELYYLNLQVNPHFLFNTLNIIYIQSRKEKAKIASEMVMQLSDMLRYQLYECEDKKVMLKSELRYIENYINLQKMRQLDTNIQYTVEGSPIGIMIYPFLFISFLENAFKYVRETENHEKNIEISFVINEKSISFAVKNTRGLVTDKSEVGGIGILNTKKRLELLCPSLYDLRIEPYDEFFYVELKIKVEND